MPIVGPRLDAPVDIPRPPRVGLDTKPDTEALVSRPSRWTRRRLAGDGGRGYP